MNDYELTVWAFARQSALARIVLLANHMMIAVRDISLGEPDEDALGSVSLRIACDGSRTLARFANRIERLVDVYQVESGPSMRKMAQSARDSLGRKGFCRVERQHRA
ncbi:hypothetical protein [Microbacterium sp. NIBRBAC000506063]|uniref:hypothetical protein n=1 Tax=Microbacterium sp. NIBRBAC000506063 TaxID=2734618 RepID=UPI001BB5E2D1|nr:hypothetical protein [Microbacterium sp. NIBRBAC000506063]QTV79583.1 hypothetical protein KAE78_12155 [Microbacterium sp. NIBRBAC000506063]